MPAFDGEAITIRSVRAEDDPEVARIIREVMTEFGATGQGFSIEDPEVDAMSAAYGGEGAALFVARREAQIVGCSGIAGLEGGEPDVCELRKMYLVPGVRGLGLGTRLLERCLAAAGEFGYALCYLETLSNMTSARRLYEKHGFLPLEHSLGRTGHHGCNAWYVRELAPKS